MKRELAQPIYGWVERGSPITIWFIALINEKFIPLISCVNVLYIWILMADMFMVFMFLLCWLHAYLMTPAMYGFQHVFTCK